MHKLSQRIYLDLFEKECAEELRLTRAKNTDYANDNNAFQNFNVIEYLTDGHTSTEIGIITRLCDKFQRVVSLLTRPPGTQKVKDESVLDTLRDISVYSKILRIYIQTKNANPVPTVANLHLPYSLEEQKQIENENQAKREKEKATSANISTR